MLLESYRMEFSNAVCRPEARTMHCVAHLDQDVGAALPCLTGRGRGVLRQPGRFTARCRLLLRQQELLSGSRRERPA